MGLPRKGPYLLLCFHGWRFGLDSWPTHLVVMPRSIFNFQTLEWMLIHKGIGYLQVPWEKVDGLLRKGQHLLLGKVRAGPIDKYRISSDGLMYSCSDDDYEGSLRKGPYLLLPEKVQAGPSQCFRVSSQFVFVQSGFPEERATSSFFEEGSGSTQ